MHCLNRWIVERWCLDGRTSCVLKAYLELVVPKTTRASVDDEAMVLCLRILVVIAICALSAVSDASPIPTEQRQREYIIAVPSVLGESAAEARWGHIASYLSERIPEVAFRVERSGRGRLRRPPPQRARRGRGHR